MVYAIHIEQSYYYVSNLTIFRNSLENSNQDIIIGYNVQETNGIEISIES